MMCWNIAMSLGSVKQNLSICAFTHAHTVLRVVVVHCILLVASHVDTFIFYHFPYTPIVRLIISSLHSFPSTVVIQMLTFAFFLGSFLVIPRHLSFFDARYLVNRSAIC